MGVASPLQSRKPLEYWLDGLQTKELVALWEFLSRNLDNMDPNDDPLVITQGSEDPPTPSEVRKHLYSESLPSNFYACKDAEGLRPT